MLNLPWFGHFLAYSCCVVALCGCSDPSVPEPVSDAAVAELVEPEQTAEELVGEPIEVIHVADTFPNPIPTPVQLAPEPGSGTVPQQLESTPVIATAPIPTTQPTAVSSVEALAQAGNADAQYQLALALADNDQAASAWYLKAAEQGHLESQLEMAVRYMDGRGVEQNAEEAERWLALAESRFAPNTAQNVVVVEQRQVQFAARPNWISGPSQTPVFPPVMPPQFPVASVAPAPEFVEPPPLEQNVPVPVAFDPASLPESVVSSPSFAVRHPSLPGQPPVRQNAGPSSTGFASYRLTLQTLHDVPGTRITAQPHDPNASRSR